MQAKYIAAKPFRTATRKFIPGETYDVTPAEIAEIEHRFEVITAKKQDKKEITDGNPEQQ